MQSPTIPPLLICGSCQEWVGPGYPDNQQATTFLWKRPEK